MPPEKQIIEKEKSIRSRPAKTHLENSKLVKLMKARRDVKTHIRQKEEIAKSERNARNRVKKYKVAKKLLGERRGKKRSEPARNKKLILCPRERAQV